jgi:hypothetical protein
MNVDLIYKTVLSIINKEQRGYMTPDEFNKTATQAQMSIIDKTFYEYNDALTKMKSKMVGSGYADIVSKSREKLEHLYRSATIQFSGGAAALPMDSFKIEGIFSQDRMTKYEEVTKDKLNYLLSSPLTAPDKMFPVFFRSSSGANVIVKPSGTSLDSASAEVDYIKLPENPRWGYYVNTGLDNYIYDEDKYMPDGFVLGQDDIIDFDTNVDSVGNGTYNGSLVNDTNPTEDKANVSVVVSGNTVESIRIVSSGSGYSVGDTVSLDNVIFFPSGATGKLTFTVTEDNLYLYSTKGSTDFILHPSEEVKLINSILVYAGIIIRDPSIVNLAAQSIQTNEAAKR